ncbi:hypothetical protein VN91_0090 [Lactococcus lactis subsp. lactis]|nr:hypothetical protein VN91_0090 [Lactococcus lactis subsp. lactis]
MENELSQIIFKVFKSNLKFTTLASSFFTVRKIPLFLSLANLLLYYKI